MVPGDLQTSLVRLVGVLEQNRHVSVCESLTFTQRGPIRVYPKLFRHYRQRLADRLYRLQMSPKTLVGVFVRVSSFHSRQNHSETTRIFGLPHGLTNTALALLPFNTDAKMRHRQMQWIET